jgi:hypothetical protein
MTTGLAFAPSAVEIGELLNSILLFGGVGVSILGDGEGSTEVSGEGLSVGGAGCRGLRNSCCGALELELVVLALSGVV